MLIRSNNLGVDDPFAVKSNSNSIAPVPLGTPSKSPPQNRYESLFIKLFAQVTIQLILSFTAILLSMVIIRDIIGLKFNLFKFSFWFQFTLNLTLLIGLIFAKMKCSTGVKSNPLSNPFEHYFNQDQMILIGIWTVSAFNLGSWYFRQYAPHIYKLFDHIKGKHSSTPVLREQYFLIWATLLSQGIVSWISSFYFKHPQTSDQPTNVPLFKFLKSRVQDVTFWPNLLNRSAMIYVTLILIHFACSWISFPIFGLVLSALFDIHQPVRHSWLAIFRIGLFVHIFSFSIFSNLIYTTIDWLIEFFMRRTFKTSSLVPDSEHLLTIGLCETRQNFIHLQACNEFLEIATESNGFRRYKLFNAVEDEGSLTRKILDWFSHELEQVKDRSDASLHELNSFFSILGTNNTELPNAEVFKQYREKTISFVELILKKIFNTRDNVSTATTTATATTPSPNSTPATNPSNGLPEIFARRGAPLKTFEDETKGKKESLPLMFEFGPLLNKNRLGKSLISLWIASRKVHCIERFENLEISIKSVASFICSSFVEDEGGQVQMALPRVLETSVETLKSLQKLLEISSSNLDESNQQIEVIFNLLNQMLFKISDTFGESLESVRISSECREFIKSL